MAIHKRESRLSSDTKEINALTLDFPTSSTVRYTFLCAFSLLASLSIAFCYSTPKELDSYEVHKFSFW